jgi:hypothetical protein
MVAMPAVVQLTLMVIGTVARTGMFVEQRKELLDVEPEKKPNAWKVKVEELQTSVEINARKLRTITTATSIRIIITIIIITIITTYQKQVLAHTT